MQHPCLAQDKLRGTPVGEEALRVVHLQVGHLEGNHLVRLRAEQQELVLLVPGLLALLVAAHEPVPGLGVLLNLRVLHLQRSYSFPRLQSSSSSLGR